MTFHLHRGVGGYTLTESGGPGKPLHIDFTAVHRRLQRGGRELVLRATGARTGVRVVDCTAGLGTDGFLLAAKGCVVTMIERSATLHLMLADALARASSEAILAPIVQRITLVRGDSLHYLSATADAVPDVVYIDTMFPARKKHALVRGEVQLLQHFLGKDEDPGPLLRAARRVAASRVVVKRPLHGAWVGEAPPSGSVRGKAARFDIYPPAGASLPTT